MIEQRMHFLTHRRKYNICLRIIYHEKRIWPATNIDVVRFCEIYMSIRYKAIECALNISNKVYRLIRKNFNVDPYLLVNSIW